MHRCIPLTETTAASFFNVVQYHHNYTSQNPILIRYYKNTTN